MSKETIGDKLRKLREENEMPLRKVAALLDIDVSILSKMERGERPLSKKVVTKLAKIYKHDEDELTILYLSQKIVNEVGEEDLALRAMQVAEEQVSYQLNKKMDRKLILKTIRDFLKSDKRVKKAWVFGSFARGDDSRNSDIDLMVCFKNANEVSLFDFADIAYLLEQKVKVKIDFVFIT